MACAIGHRLGPRLALGLLFAVAGLILSAQPTAAANIIVTTSSDSTNDDSACSLREAIANANSNLLTFDDCLVAGEGGGIVDTINFNIPGAAPHVIDVESALPVITGPTTINGLSEPDVPGNSCPLPTGGPLAVQINRDGIVSAGLVLGSGASNSTIRGLSITRFGTVGLQVDASNASITCNAIGVAADGSTAAGNVMGVDLTVSGINNTLGGPNASDGNLIAHNGSTGVRRSGGNVQIQRNTIRDSGSFGLVIGGSNNTITANTITGNGDDGVQIASGTGNRLTQNLIFNNGILPQHLAIDLRGADGVDDNDVGDGDGGVHNLQNFPILTAVTQVGGSTTVSGTLNSTASTTFSIEFFANAGCDASGHGEGQTYLGAVSVTTNGSGNVSFVANGLAAVATTSLITATATDPNGNTSEFSRCQVFGTPGVTVVPTSGLTTTEAGGTATFTVRLNTAPSAPVSIPISSSDTTEGVVGSASVQFEADLTALNPVTVTITGQNDALVDGDVPYSIILSAASSADQGYNGQNPPDVAATNRDGTTVTCSPRPTIMISTAKNNDGRLKVTVTATTSLPGAQNRLVQLQFDDGTNANVQIVGQPTRTDAFTYDIPGQPPSFVFFVGRDQAGSTYLPFRVIDGCPAQPWKTFVGGGLAAF